MARMMVYAQANQILESSLTPNNRCICKKTAIQNHAVASNLTSYADNRLVPVAAVVLITYSIQFKDWNGTVLSTQTVSYGHTPTLPANPSRTGYTFTGWSPNPGTAPSEDTVYTAQYSINSYTVTFLDANGGTFSTQNVQYGGYATAPGTNPTKTGYTFAGWSPNPASTQITSATTFTPQFTINSYTIRFLNYDGAVLQSGSIDYGVTPTYTGSTPYKGQYQTFIGWSPSISAATQNQDYTAQFRDDTPQTTYYTITWYDPDGIMSPSTQTTQVEAGTTPTPPTIPSRTDYTGSWGTITAATADKTYTLAWTYTGGSSTTTYRITWTDPSYTMTPSTESEDVEEGVTPSHSIPTRTNYVGRWDPVPYPADKDETYTIAWDENITRVKVAWHISYQGAGGESVNDWYDVGTTFTSSMIRTPKEVHERFISGTSSLPDDSSRWSPDPNDYIGQTLTSDLSFTYP